MEKIKASMLSGAVFVFCGMVGTFADAAPYYWHGDPWGDFGTDANWTLGGATSPYADTGANDGGTTPGSSDWIFFDKSHTFNLGGGTWTIQGVSTTGAASGVPSSTQKCSFTNGSVTVTTAMSQRRLSMDLWDGATFTASDGFTWYFGWTGNTGTFNIYNGAKLNLNATVRIQGVYLTVHEGGELVFAPKALSHHLSSTVSAYIANNGTLDMPNGFVWNGQFTGSGGSGRMTIRQNSGTLKLGGHVNRKGKDFPLYFEVNGGTLEVLNSPAFVDVTRAFVAANAVATINVGVGSTAQFANLEYDSGARVVKTGVGTLALASHLPETLDVNAGTVRFDAATTADCAVSVGVGARLLFAAKNNALENATAEAGALFAIDETVFASGDTVLSSSDATFLAAVVAGLNDSISAGAGYEAEVSGAAVVLKTVSGNVFDATKSDDLSDPMAWASGEVPGSDAIVYVQGEGTVAYTASSPQFANIIVEEGATLSVSGGTLAEPVDLPPVSLNYDARLLVPAGAYAQSTNGLVCAASAEVLPVLEIATNATLFLQTPGLPTAECLVNNASGLVDYGFALKNVNLKWYGQIRIVKDRGPENNVLAQAKIGTSVNGETSYIAIDCQGGTLHRYDTTATTEPSQGEMTPLMVACPLSGGTVVPVGTLRFRDYSMSVRNATGENLVPLNGTLIGVNNPPGVEIPVVFDGGTKIKLKALNVIAGGTRLEMKGPAAWFYEHDQVNDQELKRRLEIKDAARLTLTDGAVLSFTPTSSGTCKGLDCRTGEDGALSFVASNSTIGVWSWYGNACARAVVADTMLAVGQRYPKAIGNYSEDQGVYQTPLFAGFKSVEVPEDATMWVVATNIWTGAATWTGFVHDWNRVSKFGPPIIGAGSLGVTNALGRTQSSWSMTVIVTNGANTATGEAFASGDSSVGAASRLLFSDGANWAGTVVASGRVALTNITNGAESQAASVTFDAIRFDGNFPVRVWRDMSGKLTNDVVNIVSGVSGMGGFALEFINGCKVQAGECLFLGTYPSGVALPGCVAKGWVVEPEGSGETVALRLKYSPGGFVLILR